VTSRAKVREALEFIQSLIMEDGERWGDLALDWQVEDVLAILRGDLLWFLLNRPRGSSKTTDLGALVLAFLVVLLGAGGRAFGFARDRDQAKLLVNEIEGFVRRTPKLNTIVKVNQLTVTNIETAAVFEAQAADAASAHGLRGELFVVDELARWPETDNARGVWDAVLGSVVKRPDARLVVITAASTLNHWSYTDVLQKVRGDREWHLREQAGPTPWLSPRKLESLRKLLGDAEYERQVLNRWTALDTVPVTREAVEACCREAGALEPQRDRFYVHGVDLSMVSDYTVVATLHREERDGVVVIVVDRLRVWKPTRANPLDNEEVTAYMLTTARRYRGKVMMDIYQGATLHEQLRKQGIAAAEKAEMTPGANNKRALALNRLLQERRLEIPGDNPELVEELASLAFTETTPGVYRMSTVRGGQGHHDRASAISFAALELLDRAGGPRLVLDDDDSVGIVLPEAQLEQYGPIALAQHASRFAGLGDGDVDANVIGGQPSPFVVGPVGPAVEELPSGGQRSPFLAGDGDIT